jgi:hypothetical protein
MLAENQIDLSKICLNQMKEVEGRLSPVVNSVLEGKNSSIYPLPTVEKYC